MLSYPSAAFRASAPRGTVLELWDGKDVPSGLNVAGVNGRLSLSKASLGNQSAVFPDADIEVQATADVISGNWTARNHAAYNVIATATVTDPGTPAAGHEFTTLVRNGTLTTSRGSYAVSGTLVRSVWHSGSWTDYPYGPLNAANTWTAAQTFSQNATFAGVSTQDYFRSIGDIATNATAPAPTARGGLGWRTTFGSGGLYPVGFGAGFSLSSGIGGGEYTNHFISSNDNSLSLWMQRTADGASITLAGWRQIPVLDASGNLGIGVTPTAGNGLLQLASGTTKANGIAFGTDTFFYRSGAGTVDCVASSGASQVRVLDSTSVTALTIYADSATAILSSITNKPLQLRTNNAVGITIDTSQGITTAAANYVKTRSVTSAAGTTVLDSTDDTAILTGATTHTFTLPASAVGRRIFVKNRSSGALTVNRAGADTIDGGTTLNVAAGTAKILIVNGTDWCVWNA